MTVTGLTAAANFPQASQQIAPSSGQHRHNGHRASAISDVDVQSSSVANGNSSRKVGGTVDITA